MSSQAGKSANAQQGESIEKYRARQRGSSAEHAPDEWFDVLDGFKPIEVKSTQRRLSSGRSGRWRLWKSQHDKMVEQNGEYDLVVIDDDEVWRETTLTASELDEIIKQNNLSWSDSGDTHAMGSQVKILWHYAIER